MPNRASWNGKWSGEDELFAVVKTFSGKKRSEFAAKLVAAAPFSYNFGDGWRASIEVKQVDGTASRGIRKRSKGFCGYDWMVKSIIEDGAIYGPTQPKPTKL